MPARPLVLLCLLLAACGGGGGGGASTAPPVGQTAAVTIAPASIPAGQEQTELAFALTATDGAPVLLEAHFHLPPQLFVPPQDALVASVPLVTLAGEAHEQDFAVVCGDAVHAAAQALADGELFRLRVRVGQPRQPGTYTITVDGLRASSATGEAVPLASTSIPVTVTVE